MALVADIPKGNLVPAAAVDATALVLPKVLPDLPPSLRAAIKSGLSLFLESESEAEGGIIGRLADNALKNVLKGLSGPGSADDKQQAAQAVIEDLKRTAHTRARRYGRDRSARYRRHIAALWRALDKERSCQTDANAAALQDLSVSLSDEAQPPAG